MWQYNYSSDLYSDELMHYGVLGMKWGVRRDARVLAQNRRNKAVNKAKTDYKLGNISKEQKKADVKKAKSDAKNYKKNIKKQFKNEKTKEGRKNLEKDIKTQTMKEVPSRTLKKGLTTVNKFMTGYTTSVGAAIGGYGIAGLASTAATGVATTSAAALAPYTIPAAAGIVAVGLGRGYITQKVLDRLS